MNRKKPELKLRQAVTHTSHLVLSGLSALCLSLSPSLLVVIASHMHARMTGNEGKGSKREEERRVAQLNTGKGIGRKKGRIKQEKGERYSQKHSDQREKERRKSQSKGSQVGKRGGRAPRKTKDTTENRGQGDRGLLTQKKVVVKRL